MQQKRNYLFRMVKPVFFLFLTLLMLYGLNRTLTPKYRYDSANPLSETYRGFYQMNKNTVDVLFLGSSHTACGFSPQELYDAYSIRSYNLGSNSQSLWTSYYWLKEALQNQSPKAVVLDTYSLFLDERENEASHRQAFDDMRWGTVKKEAVQTICRFDKEQSALSYFLTNIRYHSRWSGLQAKDFSWMRFLTPPQLKGTWRYHNICGYEEYTPLTTFAVENNEETENFQADAEEYLCKIAALCREKNIHLILVKTPTLAETPARHNRIMAFAKENGLNFYDFNMEELYHAIDFNYARDMSDNATSGAKNAHANPYGRQKLTNYLGKILLENYAVPSVSDSQWENTRAFNEGMKKDFLLCHETNPETYLSMLKDARYTVWIAVKDEASASLNKNLQAQLRALGLTADWENALQKSYFAVIEQGNVVVEKMAEERLEHQGAFAGKKIIYQISSAGASCGNDCSIQINAKEQAKRSRGLNIVVYSHDAKAVVDSVCFDTYAEELTAVR